MEKTALKKKTKRNDKVALGGYIAASIILFLMSELITNRGISSVEQHSNAQIEALALESCRGISVYDVAEIEISIMKSLKRAIIRSFFPDGLVETWLRCIGRVRAGIELSSLTRNDIQISTDVTGNRHATLRLPAPQITHKELNDAEWGNSHNFWVWTPDRIALQLRQELRKAAYSELEERALETGLLEEARSSVVEIVANALSALNISTVEVIMEDNRMLEIGPRAILPERGGI